LELEEEAGVTVFVRDQPRCYSKICDDGLDLSMVDKALFEQFTVQETQAQANDHADGLAEQG
jgi:hypothetical protein